MVESQSCPTTWLDSNMERRAIHWNLRPLVTYERNLVFSISTALHHQLTSSALIDVDECDRYGILANMVD